MKCDVRALSLGIGLTVEEQSSTFTLRCCRNWSKSTDVALSLWPKCTGAGYRLQCDLFSTKNWLQSCIGKGHVNDRAIPPCTLEFVDTAGTAKGTISVVAYCIWQDTGISSKAWGLVVGRYGKSRTWQLYPTFNLHSCPHIQASNGEVAPKTWIPFRSKLNTSLIQETIEMLAENWLVTTKRSILGQEDRQDLRREAGI